MQDKTEYIFLSNGYRGGASTFIRDHINFLARNNKNTSLIDSHPKKTYDQLNKNVLIYKIGDRKKINKILNKGLNKKFLFITNYAFLIKYYFLFKNFRKNNNKIVLTIHSGLEQLNLKNYFAAFFFSLIYQNIDYLFFGSNSAKNWWLNKYPWMKIKNCNIFYNGIKPNKIIQKKIGNKINIAFAGRLEKEHNPYFFLDIAKKVLKDKKNIFFNIYGDGTLLKILKKKYKSKGIIFHGWVKKDKIFKRTDLLMITSPVHNYPYVALEAKSYGIPVISCSKGDISKIIKNGKDGFIRHTDNIGIMIKLVNKILENYKYFSHNSYLRSFKFDINDSCKKFWRKIKIENYNLR
jgi:glycosyltransferase involved in cell wall biosynthesis